MSAANTNPRAITITIDPDQPLPDRYLGTSEDGPEYGPVTLTDAIIAAAVQSLIGYGEKYAREFIAKRIESAVSDAIADRLPSLIDDAFDATIEVGDDWSGTRQSKTLRALVVERARKDLDLRDMRSSFDRSPAAKFIHEEIECIVRDDLKNEFNAARDAVRKKVTTKAAELLAAETMREAGIR